MDFSAPHREEIEKKLVEAILHQYEEEVITESEMSEISGYILDHIDSLKNHEELIVFLRELSAKWPMFSNILVIESGEVQVAHDQQTVTKILELAKGGNIDQALDMAKQAVNPSVTNPTENKTSSEQTTATSENSSPSPATQRVNNQTNTTN